MGLLTFREVEARGLLKQKEVRTVLKQEKRQHRSGQGEMFSADVMSPKVTHEDRTRRRHLERALAALESLLSERGDVSWDTLLLTALQFPLVNEADAKAWLEGQRRDGFVEVLGLEGRETKPKLGKGHRVRRRHVR